MGAGARRRDRRGDRAGRRSRCRSARRAACTSTEFGNFSDLEQFIDGRRAEGRAAPGAPAGHADADPPGRVPRAHARARSTASRCRPIIARRRREAAACSRRSAFGLTSEQLRVVVIAPAGPDRHDRHRHRARGRAAAVGRHREPARRLRRRRRDGEDAVTAARRRARPTRGSSRCCSATRTTSTTTTRTSSASSTTAARSVCSTTRSSTARTC